MYGQREGEKVRHKDTDCLASVVLNVSQFVWQRGQSRAHKLL